jgi:hypothetical protein
MLQTPYLASKIHPLFRTAPWIIGEFDARELSAFANVVPPGHILKPRIPGMMSPQQRAALQLMQAQRRGMITRQQQLPSPPPTNSGLKA